MWVPLAEALAKDLTVIVPGTRIMEEQPDQAVALITSFVGN